MDCSQQRSSFKEQLGRYEICGHLGRGSFGEVLKAIDKYTGDTVALKKIFLRNPEDGLPDNVMREYKALQILQHENIMHLFEVCTMSQHIVLVLELCHTDLFAALQSSTTRFPDSIVKRIMLNLLQGVRAMHDKGIIHRDLKPSNLMLDAAGRVKIADFGLCRPALPPGRTYSFPLPTRVYCAPELLFGCKTYNGFAVDMWSVGCIFAQLLGGRPLFQGEGELGQLSAIMKVRGAYKPETWHGADQLPDYGKVMFPEYAGQSLAALLPDASPEALKLLDHMLMYNPVARPSAQEALLHDYFLLGPLPAAHSEVRDFFEGGY